MVGNKNIIAWLSHRAGKDRLDALPMTLRYVQKALNLNDAGPDFTASFGKQEIEAFVGFVDLVGFSGRIKGRSPREISSYLQPYLSGVTNEVVDRGGLVDKTIGDEVMLVQPELAGDGGVPSWLMMGQTMGALLHLQRTLGPDYPFRIGLSYGTVYVDCVDGKGYREWTVVGECVNLAKRLHSLEELDVSSGIGGAFGVLVSEPSAARSFKPILELIAGFASHWQHRVLPDREFKGTSIAKVAILQPPPASAAT